MDVHSSKSSKGYLSIETTSRNYRTGDSVQGIINLNVSQPVKARFLILQFSGEEIGMWNPEGTGYRVLKEMTYIPDSQIGRGNVINQHFPVFAFPSEIQPGQYSFPFVFTLPADIPGSFHLEYGQIDARITYSLLAFLEEGPDIDVETSVLYIHVTHILTDRSVPMPDTGEIRIQTGCCCGNQGFLHMNVSLSKNAYVPGEAVEFSIDVDNSRCRIDVIGFEATLFRTTRVTSNDGKSCIKKEAVWSSTSSQRIPQGGAIVGGQGVRMKIMIDGNRPDIMYAVSVHSRYIDCFFSVHVKAVMSSRLSGGGIPEVERQVQIYPILLPMLQSRLTQGGWDPNVMSMMQFQPGTTYNYTPSVPIDHRQWVKIV